MDRGVGHHEAWQDVLEYHESFWLLYQLSRCQNKPADLLPISNDLPGRRSRPQCHLLKTILKDLSDRKFKLYTLSDPETLRVLTFDRAQWRRWYSEGDLLVTSAWWFALFFLLPSECCCNQIKVNNNAILLVTMEHTASTLTIIAN